MNQLQHELQSVKQEVLNMWLLVERQLEKAKEAMQHMDKDMAREVAAKEKRVNALELKIDRDCENIFALYCPVAVDLRFLLAVLKINTNLERTGDIAEGIAKYIINADHSFTGTLMQRTEVITMFDQGIHMLSDTRKAFEIEDTTLARSIFEKDDLLDTLNLESDSRVLQLVKEDPSELPSSLKVMSIIRKLERVGDQAKNMAEEVIFYVEAKVLKHKADKHLDTEQD